MNKVKILFSLTLSFITLNLSAQSDLDKLREYVNGSQLVIYTESSIALDSSSSALTYVNFCADGTYYYNYEGSFTVKGSKHTSNEDSRAYGAGNAANSGKWQVLEYQGGYYLEVIDATETKTYYPIDVQKLISGKWKQGNTTYVFAPGRGECP